jgi:hypothetical protein
VIGLIFAIPMLITGAAEIAVTSHRLVKDWSDLATPRSSLNNIKGVRRPGHSGASGAGHLHIGAPAWTRCEFRHRQSIFRRDRAARTLEK